MSKPIPEQMTAVVLRSHDGAEGLRVERRPVPKPGRDQVLVAIAASPINPSDLAVLHGRYGFSPELPFVPGGEGAGVVVATGPGVSARYFRDKRVACLWDGKGDGAWAEYMVASTRGGVLPLHDSLTLEQGAMATINPLTASAFIEIAKSGHHDAFVLTAAASSLGRMVNRLARAEGIQVINVVRRPAQVAALRERGASEVFDTSDPEFDAQLRDACQRHGPRLAFDAVAGELTRRVLAALGPGSKVTVFGALSFAAAEVSPDQLIFEGKSVDGFWLGPYIRGKSLLGIMRMWRRAQRLVATDLRSEIKEAVPLEQGPRAVADYLLDMTGGKRLLRPGEA